MGTIRYSAEFKERALQQVYTAARGVPLRR